MRDSAVKLKNARLQAITLLGECTSRDCWRNKGSNWNKCKGCEIEVEFQKIRAILKK